MDEQRPASPGEVEAENNSNQVFVSRKTAKNWLTQPIIPAEISDALCDYPQGFRQLLYNRGIVTPEAALAYLEAEGSLHDPFLLDGMETAVQRILRALAENESIVVYGDYDVDGVSSTAMLVSVLTRLGALVQAYIPDRFDEGYGVNTQSLTELAAQGVNLIITVDCGIRSVAEVDAANELGVDIILSDHHYPGGPLPKALAVINPKKPSDPYPNKDLSGVGVAYKIAEALTSRMDTPKIDPRDYLDLVALGTVADIVPLLGENRALVKAGIKKMREGRNIGLRALAGAARIEITSVKSRDIGFMLAPRLNAAGRIDSARISFDLLIANDPNQAAMLAQKLDDLNRQRQNMVVSMADMARREINGRTDCNILISFHPDYAQGVVGLVASRLTEDYYRPAIIGQIKGDVAVASCRSIPEFHITQNLDLCADLFERHGGHEMAAGFTIKTDLIDECKQRLGALADEALTGKDIAPSLHADYDIPLRKVPANILDSIGRIEPTGQNNPEVYFISRNVEVVWKKRVGSDGSHLSMFVRDGSKTYPAIAFRKGDLIADLPERIDLLYSLSRNEYNGTVSTQLMIKDLKPAGSD
jgi:single-stranded-DNA-specific exonuclease